MNTVTVIGSINMDTTLRLTNMPKPGETMHAHEIFTLAEVKVPIKQWQPNVQAHGHLLLEALGLTAKDNSY